MSSLKTKIKTAMIQDSEYVGKHYILSFKYGSYCIESIREDFSQYFDTFDIAVDAYIALETYKTIENWLGND